MDIHTYGGQGEMERILIQILEHILNRARKNVQF